MKNIDILKMYNALSSDTLVNSKTALSTVVLAGKLKNIRILTPYVQDWETAKNELIKRFGSADENGNYSVPTNHPDFVKEFNALNNIEHGELRDALKFVKIEDLPETMDPREFELLSVMIDLE